MDTLSIGGSPHWSWRKEFEPETNGGELGLFEVRRLGQSGPQSSAESGQITTQTCGFLKQQAPKLLPAASKLRPVATGGHNNLLPPCTPKLLGRPSHRIDRSAAAARCLATSRLGPIGAAGACLGLREWAGVGPFGARLLRRAINARHFCFCSSCSSSETQPLHI